MNEASNPLRLTMEEKGSSVVREIVARLESLIEANRNSLEKDKDSIETAMLRGKNKAFRQILAELTPNNRKTRPHISHTKNGMGNEEAFDTD